MFILRTSVHLLVPFEGWGWAQQDNERYMGVVASPRHPSPPLPLHFELVLLLFLLLKMNSYVLLKCTYYTNKVTYLLHQEIRMKTRATMNQTRIQVVITQLNPNNIRSVDCLFYSELCTLCNARLSERGGGRPRSMGVPPTFEHFLLWLLSFEN